MVRMFLAAVAVVIASGGCAALFNARHRMIQLDSQPAGALVRMNGLRVGLAPLAVSASTKQGARFTFEWADGARAACDVTPHVEPYWVFPDLLVGGLVGPIIDLASGRMRDLGATHCLARHP